jgi:hypothetical protein
MEVTMSRRFLTVPSLTLLALFALAAPLLAKTNSAANASPEMPLAAIAQSPHGHLPIALDQDSQATEFCCSPCDGGYGGHYAYWPGYSYWGYPYSGYWYYPYWGYASAYWSYGWPSYYSWWPHYYAAYYPGSWYWWQYPWWSYPASTYYWWQRTQIIAPPARALEKVQIPVAGTPDSLFSEGLTAYWDGDAARASEILHAAVAANPNDARFWYFKALAERAAGNAEEALASARRGAALQVLHAPDASQLAMALERVQGPDRQFLRSALTADLTRDKSLAIVAEPVKRGQAVVRIR